MMSTMRIVSLTIPVLVATAMTASAQPIAPNGGGGGLGVSPYLNLLRNNANNNNPAFNFLTITRPQLALAQQANQLNQNLQQTNQQLQFQQQQQGQGGILILGGDTGQPVTGHRTTFGNLGNRFNSFGGGGAGGGVRIGGGIGQGMNQFGAGGGMRAGMGAGAGAAGAGAAMGARGMGAVGGIRR